MPLISPYVPHAPLISSSLTESHQSICCKS
jgi:hypothetical protein